MRKSAIHYIAIFSVFVYCNALAEENNFPTGVFLGVSKNNATSDRRTPSWENSKIDMNHIGKNDIDFLSIRETGDDHYMVNIEVHGFAAPRYYTCQFAGIFEQEFDGKQKIQSLILDEKYKPLDCDLRVVINKGKFLLKGDCSRFCSSGYSMNGFSIPRKIPKELKKLNIGN